MLFTLLRQQKNLYVSVPARMSKQSHLIIIAKIKLKQLHRNGFQNYCQNRTKLNCLLELKIHNKTCLMFSVYFTYHTFFASKLLLVNLLFTFLSGQFSWTQILLHNNNILVQEKHFPFQLFGNCHPSCFDFEFKFLGKSILDLV